MNAAVAKLADAANGGGRRAGSREPLKVLGAHPRTEAEIKLMEGRFGPYVTDGTTNATLPKSVAPDQITLEEAAQLIDERAAKGPPTEEGQGPQGAREETGEGEEMMLRYGLPLLALVDGHRRAGAGNAAAPAPNPANADLHFQYLNRLDPAQGWRRTPSGLRYRRISGNGRGRAPDRQRHGDDPLCRHLHRRHRVRQLGPPRRARDLPARPPDPRLAGRRADDGHRRPLRIRHPLQPRLRPVGRGPIPGGATLLFTIDLIAIAAGGANAVVPRRRRGPRPKQRTARKR